MDTPKFREIITLYEQELESNAAVVKNLVRECRNMIKMTEGRFPTANHSYNRVFNVCIFVYMFGDTRTLESPNCNL